MAGESAPRYEFRIWPDDATGIVARLAALSTFHDRRESSEIYFVSTATVSANPKARDDLLDIKVLKAEVDGFEQWDVHLKAELPVDASVLAEELFPLLGVPTPPLERARYTLEELVHLVAPQHEVAAVAVTKRRDRRELRACSAEVAEVTIAGDSYTTVAIESADLEALREACRITGLGGLRNVNYPRAIRARLGGRFAID